MSERYRRGTLRVPIFKFKINSGEGTRSVPLRQQFLYFEFQPHEGGDYQGMRDVAGADQIVDIFERLQADDNVLVQIELRFEILADIRDEIGIAGIVQKCRIG